VRGDTHLLLNFGAYDDPPDVFFGETKYFTQVSTRSAAAFGEANVHLGNTLTVFAGARYTHEKVSEIVTGFPVNPGNYNFQVAGGTSLDASISANNLSGRMGMRWAYDPNNMFYATLSRDVAVLRQESNQQVSRSYRFRRRRGNRR